MKILLLMFAVVLFVGGSARSELCCDEEREPALPGLTPYQSENVYRGEQCNGCPCPVFSDGSVAGTLECRTGGSIDTPG